MSWRQRLGAFIGGFDAGQHHRRLRGFRATRAHVNALIAASGCGFRKFPDTDFSNSRTRVSVNPGQGFR
jgi:hypothetical protein